MAKAFNLVGGGQPQVNGAFASWVSKITIEVYTQTVSDGLVSNVWTEYSFSGAVMPYSGEEMEYDMDGQRSWDSMQVFVANDVPDLRIGDRVRWSGKLYKVVRRWDFHQNGYRRYVMNEISESILN